MKQLLIVNSSKALNATGATPYDLSGLEAGAITFFELGEATPLAAAPKKNFGIALGRPNNSTPFVIPEVDINTLTVVKSAPKLGKAFSAEFTVPNTISGATYTMVLVKNGTVPHERNTWTATETIPQGKTVTAAKMAELLGTSLGRMAKSYTVSGTTYAGAGAIDVTVTVASAKITITGVNVGEQWTLKLGDELYGTTVTTTLAEDTVGDKKYIQKLAQECAAGKGFTDVYPDGATIYPGYPETVEDITPNAGGTAGYAVFTLRFAVGRDASKTRDERVSQLVHIAVPVSATAYSAIETILTQPVLVNKETEEQGG